MPFQISQPFEQKAPPPRGARIALVIGNKSYNFGALRNPANDALKVAATLKRLGFEVKCLIDLKLEQMNATLDEFTKNSRQYETALIYYAGHGMQVDNVNVLVPIDFDLPEKATTVGYSSSVVRGTVNLGDILEATKAAVRTMIFLDACREFPEDRRVAVVPEVWRSIANRGFGDLISEQERDNLVVSFAAAAGEKALDGEKRNSPYTLAFTELAVKPIKIDELLGELRYRVIQATDGRQRPRQINTLAAPFSLAEGISAIETHSFSGGSEEQIFADAVVLDTAEGYRYFLQEFPDGDHAALARSALSRLSGNERVRIQAPLRECADPPFFTPGRGLNEWFQDAKDAPQMVVIPAMPPSLASITRGGGASVPARPFAVSRTPITFAQWSAAVAAGGITFEPSDNGGGRGARPVVNVSWHQAQAYVDWLSMLTGCTYRLPTVAEWEHCCRGRPGDEIAVGSEDAASRGAMAGSVETGNRIVGLEPPNGLGLSDMLGNVWEWCADIGSGAAYRKAKGGGRKGASLRHTEEFDVSAGELFIGFRIVREIPADVATPGLATLRA